MEQIDSILERFPQREFEIRQRCANDEQFRSVCVDYEDAAKALRHWRTAAQAGDRRVEEYALFLSELETEILTQLDSPRRSAG
jgi:hypothetical protein